MLPRDLGRHRQGSVVSVAWGIRAPHPQSLGSGENAGIPGAGRARFGILCGLELESRRGPRQAVVGFSDPVSRLDFNFGFHFDRLGHGLSETCDRGRPTGHDSQLSFHTEASLNADRRSWLDGLLVDATAHSAVGGGGRADPLDATRSEGPAWALQENARPSEAPPASNSASLAVQTSSVGATQASLVSSVIGSAWPAAVIIASRIWWGLWYINDSPRRLGWLWGTGAVRLRLTTRQNPWPA